MITKDELRGLLADVQRRFPGNVNPVVDQMCAYNAPSGRRCLFGQLAHEQGWPVTEGQGAGHHIEITEVWPVEADAAMFASRVQTALDCLNDDWTESVVKWGSINLNDY